MTIHGIKVKIFKFNMDPDASEILQATWVKIYGLPSIACNKKVMMKVATLVGESLEMDELSLIKIWPMLVRMNCRDPYKLRGFVKTLFNKIVYEIRFLFEKYKDKTLLPPPPPPEMIHRMMMGKRIMRNLRMTMIENIEGSITKTQTSKTQDQGPNLGKSMSNKTLQKGPNQESIQGLGSQPDVFREKRDVTQKVEQVRVVSSNLGSQDKGTCSSMSKDQHVDKDPDQGNENQVMGLLVSKSGAQGPDQNVEGT
jgi:hypothetical protein